MTTAIKKGMIAHFEEDGYDDLEASEMSHELYEDLDGALDDAHGEDSDLSSTWVSSLVDEYLDGDFELLGILAAKAHMGDVQAIVDAGIPHQFYDHIMEMA